MLADELDNLRMKEVSEKSPAAMIFARDIAASGQSTVPPAQDGVFIHAKFRGDLFGRKPLPNRDFRQADCRSVDFGARLCLGRLHG